MKRKKLPKRIRWVLLIVFVLMNVVSYIHAYKFTHFTDRHVTRTSSVEKLSTVEKIKALLAGVDTPRPVNITTTAQKFETILVKGNNHIAIFQGFV